jgi:hypothetical protein
MDGSSEHLGSTVVSRGKRVGSARVSTASTSSDAIDARGQRAPVPHLHSAPPHLRTSTPHLFQIGHVRPLLRRLLIPSSALASRASPPRETTAAPRAALPQPHERNLRVM